MPPVFKHPFIQWLLGVLCGLAVLAGILWLIDLLLGYEAMMRTTSVFVSLFVLSIVITTVIWVRDAFNEPDEDPSSPVKLETFNDSIQASLLVSWLEEYGINSTAVGGFVSGFQAESPGYVDVMVSQDNLDEARTLMEEWQRKVE